MDIKARHNKNNHYDGKGFLKYRVKYQWKLNQIQAFVETENNNNYTSNYSIDIGKSLIYLVSLITLNTDIKEST